MLTYEYRWAYKEPWLPKKMGKQILALKKSGQGLLALAITIFGLAPATAYADTYPYFHVAEGDTWAGGWFDSGSAACSAASANYQDPNFNGSSQGMTQTSDSYGGIKAYSTENGGDKYNGGASTDFGAYALGEIEGGGNNGNFGFASGAVQANQAVDRLTFSNTTSGEGPTDWGGLFAGSTPQTHCIPDYYSKKPASAQSVASLTAAATGNELSGAKILSGSAPGGQTYEVNSSALQIDPGAQITMYVNGPAYIDGNITYKAGFSVDTTPKFALVVSGSLYIDPSVTQLDGVYIAQPTDPSSATAVKDDSGEIWTCHDGTTSLPDSSYLTGNCQTNPLTVSGSLIAKRVNLLRISGDVKSSGPPAETIDYTPAMVINGPFFNPPGGSSLKVESLVSLPPVF